MNILSFARGDLFRGNSIAVIRFQERKLWILISDLPDWHSSL
jgi:hypothetical protein